MQVTYENDKKIAYYNGHRFTRDDRTGYYLASRPINGRRWRLHVYIWMTERGAIPEGYQVHHKDEDKGNNDISNFECMPRHDHLSYHSRRMTKENKEKWISAGIEAAKAWHSGEEGRAWHKSHYEQNKDKLHAEREQVCEYCGKKFVTKNADAKFCCNAHKTYARNKSGVDNEKRACVICGGSFTVNKYCRTQTCSPKCRGILHGINMRKAKAV